MKTVNSTRRPRIAFLTWRDPHDRKSWSGIYYYMGKALQEHVGDVSYVGPLHPLRMDLLRVCNRVSRIVCGRKFDYMHSIMLSKKFASMAAKKLRAINPDVIFAPAASAEIAYLRTDVPIILASDATLSLVLDYYPDYSKFWPRLQRTASVVETKAFEQARMLFFSSSWAAQSARDDYHAKEEKIRVFPFGANIDDIPAPEVILQRRKGTTCRLLFAGVNWERKGGALALSALRALLGMGLDTELTVCGCVPPKGIADSKMTIIPFLDKNNPLEHKKYTELLLRSDFFFLPTRAESFGIVFCEAAAYGLPVISTLTGGVPDVVRNGKNGFLLPYEATGEDYAAMIYRIFHDDHLYASLVRSSRSAFDERLNWHTWGVSVRDAIREL